MGEAFLSSGIPLESSEYFNYTFTINASSISTGSISTQISLSRAPLYLEIKGGTFSFRSVVDSSTTNIDLPIILSNGSSKILEYSMSGGRWGTQYEVFLDGNVLRCTYSLWATQGSTVTRIMSGISYY